MLFQILGMIHPMLRTVKLPSELLNKKNRVIKLRVGNPISVETQNSFADLIQYGKFLRAKTYLLGSSLEGSISPINLSSVAILSPEASTITSTSGS